MRTTRPTLPSASKEASIRSRDADRYLLHSWAAATDGVAIGYGCGGSILVPDHVMRAVLEAASSATSSTSSLAHRCAARTAHGACSRAIWSTGVISLQPRSSPRWRRFTTRRCTAGDVALRNGSPIHLTRPRCAREAQASGSRSCARRSRRRAPHRETRAI